MVYLYVVIVVISLFVRTLEVVSSGMWACPLRGQPTEEVRIGQHLAAGRGFVTPYSNLAERQSSLCPSAVSPPGYPYLLAGLIRVARLLTGDEELPYRISSILGIVSGSVAAGLLALAGSRAAGSLGGWAAGLIAAFWPRLITTSALLWDTPYAVLAVAVGATFAAPRPKPRSTSWYGAVGLLGGLATLFQPTVAPFLAAATAARLTAEGQGLRRGLIVAIAWLFCLAPWFARNAVEFHRWIPIRNGAGLELWIGNQPDADGTNQNADASRRHPANSFAEQRLIAQIGEDSYMQIKTKDAMNMIRESPVRFLRLTAWRAWLYWFGDVTRPTRLLGKFAPMLFGLNQLKAAVNGLLLTVALAGLWRWQSPPGRLALGFGILTLPMPYYLTHVSPVYRAFVDPLLCLLAGTFLAQIVTWFSDRLHGDHGRSL